MRSESNVSTCPECGCRAQDHNAVNRVPDGLIAHCGGCGACWTTADSEFTRTVWALLTERPWPERAHA